MNWRAVVIVLLVVFSLVNGVVRLWGDWGHFLPVLVAQGFFVFGGIYPFLYGRTMLLRFGATLKASGNTELRIFTALVYTLLYLLMFLVS